jgi:hypothetical protein
MVRRPKDTYQVSAFLDAFLDDSGVIPPYSEDHNTQREGWTMRLILGVLVSAIVVFAVLVVVGFATHAPLASPPGTRPAAVQDVAPRLSAPVLIEQDVCGYGGCL